MFDDGAAVFTFDVREGVCATLVPDQEGIALRSIDIDIIYVYGYGFPAVRGGPMMHADRVGLKQVYDRVCEFQASQGFWWEPAPLLKELAETGGTFAEYHLQTT